MRWLEKLVQMVLWGLVGILGLYILYRGFQIGNETGFFREKLIPWVTMGLQESAIEVLAPTLMMEGAMEPVSESEEGTKRQPGAEKGTENDPDKETTVAAGAATDPDQETTDAAEAATDPVQETTDTAEAVTDPNQKMTDTAEAATDLAQETAGTLEAATDQNLDDVSEASTEEAAITAKEESAEQEKLYERDEKLERASREEPETETEAVTEPAAEALEASLPLEQMHDFNYLLNNYFTMDVSTITDETQLNYDTLTRTDLSIEKDPSVPQILIYHTHSQEAFVDSAEGDVNATIVGVGARLKEILESQYGYNVVHHTAVYDMVDGVLDRSKAYELAEADIPALLADNPTIEVVIDLHRDGVDGQKFVTEINGKPTARIMFFNGLSRTALNGPVDYLPNPYIEENLAFSFQLQLLAEQKYPDFTRHIYLQSLRYNLHFKPRSLLIECGTQLNTVEEEYNAMEPLADILNQVLQPG